MKKTIYNGNLKEIEIELSVLRAEQRKDIERVEEQTDLKFEATKNATLIFTNEVSRRLDMLNGEAGRLKEMQITYLPRDIYSIEHKELAKKVERHEDYISENRGKEAIFRVVVPALISLAFLFLNYLLTGAK